MRREVRQGGRRIVGVQHLERVIRQAALRQRGNPPTILRDPAIALVLGPLSYELCDETGDAQARLASGASHGFSHGAFKSDRDRMIVSHYLIVAQSATTYR